MMKYLGLICLAACTAFALADEHKHEQQGVAFSNAYVRGMPPGQTTTAAFGTLHNALDKPLTLKKMHTDVADKVEMHSHSMANGVMQMREIKPFQLAAGETVVFAPGGKHIMLIGLKKTLHEGEKIRLEMCFEEEVCSAFDVPVVSVLNEEAADHAHHH